LNSNLPPALDSPFEELFDSAIDKALLLLGESGRKATYYHIEKTFRLKRDAWHKNPEAFAEAVEQIFGPGSQLLLEAIVKELYADLGLKFQETKQFSFAHFVRQAQRYSRGGEEFD
jgi:hypothetical protein